MGSQEIEAINSSSCIIQVGFDRRLKEEDVPDVGGALIFRISRSLPESDRSYTPRFVSIGPFHHGKKKLKGMEKSKDEAVRRMQVRFQKTDQQASIKSFVEQVLMPKDKEIRRFYGEHISCTPIQLAWMVTRDACFIYEFLLNYLRGGVDAKRIYKREEKEFSWKYDAVFDVEIQSPIREGLLSDLLLFENQIPLWILKDGLQIRMGSPEVAGQKLDELARFVLICMSRHKIFRWQIPPSHKHCSHVLDILHRSLVGSNVKDYQNHEAYQLPPLGKYRMQIYFRKIIDSMKLAVCGRWHKLCLCFPSLNRRPGNTQQTLFSAHNGMQIWFKSGVDSMRTICGRWCKHCLCFLSSKTSSGQIIQLAFVKLPTASELTRAGVSIHPVTVANRPEQKGSAIRWIRFDEKTATLYLPEMMVTQQLYSVLSNLIAMEVTTRGRYNPRPMTQYVLLMDELIDNEDDVAVLRKTEVIHNFLGSNQQVADLFNSLGTGMIPGTWCKVINDARMGLHKFMGRKYKILWSEFLTAYFSKPWLVCGSIAAVLLIWMTMTQVLCLFITCNPKSS